MKFRLVVYILTLSTTLAPIVTKAQKISGNKSAKIDSVFMDNFAVVNLYVKNTDSDPSLKRIEAIHFLESLTGISSKTDGTFFGKMSCSSEDVENWLAWYVQNRSCLTWNKRRKIIIKTD
jgi:hypothetical protein